MNASQKKKPWQFVTFKSRLTEDLVTLGTTAALGLVLSQIFNPLVVGGAALYGLGRTLFELQAMTNKEKAINKMVEKGQLKPPLGKYKKVQTMIDSFTAAAGAPHQTFMLATKKFVDPELSSDEQPKDTVNEAMRNMAGAITSLNLILTTEAYIKKHSEDGLRYTMAHEVAHARANDSASLRSALSKAAAYTSEGLALALFGNLAAGFATLGTVVMSGAILIGSAIGAKMGYNSVSRLMERRADRNAIYLTRTPEKAIDTLRTFISENKPKPTFEIGTHPSFHRRAAQIRRSFEIASKYPVPPTAIKPEPAPTNQHPSP